MILKLNGADFSANNLGTVQVRNDLLPFTERAITASGNTGMSGVQKSALDNLFRAMGADGSNNVMSKMRKIYLPIIANDVTKAMVNYADSSFANDKSLDSTKWFYRNHGIVANAASGNAISLTLDRPLTTNNFFALMLRTEVLASGVDDSTYGIVVRGKTETGKFLGISQPSLSSHRYTSLGSYGMDWGYTWAKENDLIKPSAINFGSGNLDVCTIGTWHDTTQPSTYTDLSGETSETLYVFGLGGMNTTKAYGVAMIGEAVTLEQAKLIVQRIDELWEAFNAA